MAAKWKNFPFILRINEKASDKVLEVEKYNEIRKPVYDKRNDIIKAISDFWLTSFLSHPALTELVTEEDHKVFNHLTSIDVEDSKDVKLGYSITFIKDVKKRKERAKELEGIDLSNIVSSESELEESENDDDDEDGEEGDEEVENEEADEDQGNGSSDNKSEDSDKGNSDSDSD